MKIQYTKKFNEWKAGQGIISIEPSSDGVQDLADIIAEKYAEVAKKNDIDLLTVEVNLEIHASMLAK